MTAPNASAKGVPTKCATTPASRLPRGIMAPNTSDHTPMTRVRIFVGHYRESSLTPCYLSLRHEWPEDRDENAGYDPEDDVERRADFREVGEAITARAKHVGVGLMSDGRGKTRGATKHDRNGKWSRIHSHRRCDLERDRSY